MAIKIIFVFLFISFTWAFFTALKEQIDIKFWRTHQFKNFCIKVHGIPVWRSRSVAVIALVYYLDENGEPNILANKRGNGTPDFQGYWNMPCGYLDYNESGEEAASRELYEETGLSLPPNSFHFISVNTKPSENRQNIGLRYAVQLPMECALRAQFSLKHMEKDEVESISWIKLSDVNKHDWAFEHDKLIPQLLESC